MQELPVCYCFDFQNVCNVKIPAPKNTNTLPEKWIEHNLIDFQNVWYNTKMITQPNAVKSVTSKAKGPAVEGPEEALLHTNRVAYGQD